MCPRWLSTRGQLQNGVGLQGAAEALGALLGLSVSETAVAIARAAQTAQQRGDQDEDNQPPAGATGRRRGAQAMPTALSGFLFQIHVPEI